MQEQLLKKVEGVKNSYSVWLFLEYSLNDWDLLNCKGIQENDHKCLKKRMACKVRVKNLCGCRDMLLQCQLVEWVKQIQETLMPTLQANKPVRRNKYWAHT